MARQIRPRALHSLLALLLCSAPVSYAGDILRGGTGTGNGRKAADARANAGAAAANLAKVKAADRLSRTTQALNAMRQMQASARAAGVNSGFTDGLYDASTNPTGGLKRLTTDVFLPGTTTKVASPKWEGADLPVQSGNVVTIKQTKQQALLNWETFNVGSKTTLNFNQSAGGKDSGKWIAFNRVFDPSGQPSKILGRINADGQVYVINQNGIIFGSGSQTTTRTFVASTLPINENLIARGLLNQNAGKAEFLFSALPTGTFAPPPALTASGRSGDIVVAAGASLTTPDSGEGNGGRVMLVGANVVNSGAISTPAGQTVLTAGLQVGTGAHNTKDPSLRGIDVFIGSVGTYAGQVTNSGLINIPAGSLVIAGKNILQNGAVDSVTSVTLNGRIDVFANYDAVPNGDYNPAITSGIAPFLNRSAGSVSFGSGSLTRILPDSNLKATSVGASLPERSQINIQANTVDFASNAMVLAPSAKVSIQAGVWKTLIENTTAGVTTYTGPRPDFIFTSGRVSIEKNAFIDVSGLTDVFVPLANNILQIQLRGSELSVSPLQRKGSIRGVPLTVDTRVSGTYQGRAWIGTPLGDASGFANIIERNAQQLSVSGGSIVIQAGDAVTAKSGSILDVSGGYSRNEGGRIETSRLLKGGVLVNITEATPDQLYDGVYSPVSTRSRAKWGITEDFYAALAPNGVHSQKSYLEGASGGQLSLTAGIVTTGGTLSGQTVIGPRQLRKSSNLSELPGYSSLSLSFKKQDPNSYGSLENPYISPTPPLIIFGNSSGPSFEGATPQIVSTANQLILSTDFYSATGFGRLSIDNSDGNFLLPAGERIEMPASGALSVAARNVVLLGSIRSPGGSLSFTAYNLSPYQSAILRSDPLAEAPPIDPAMGTVRLGTGATLDVSGSIVDDRLTSRDFAALPMITKGGSVVLTGYNVYLPEGSRIDASGGVGVNPRGGYSYGNAGSISVLAGQDPKLPSILGGKLILDGALLGYSGATGGTLSLKAPAIQIGGSTQNEDTLLLTPEFFNKGGFSTFKLTGIGAKRSGPAIADPDAPDSFVPAIYIAPGTVIEPTVESLAYVPFPGKSSSTRRVIVPEGKRPAFSIGFYAPGVNRDFAVSASGPGRGDLLVRGDIVLGEGASILAGPLGSVTFDGQTVSLLGSVSAPGGRIEAIGAGSFPVRGDQQGAVISARTTVYIGPSARLSAAGSLVLVPDPFGRRLGSVNDGGAITVSGNIFAEKGAVLDVSGASAILDVHPSKLEGGFLASIPTEAGINSRPWSLRSVPYAVESNGGVLTLAGSQLLISNATLLGAAGGPGALGGKLAVSSGRFYSSGAAQYGSDINMVVTQGALAVSPTGTNGIGRPIRDANSAIVPGMGYFSANTFAQGGFDSLDLGYNFDRPTGLTSGGNVEFRGPVSINARGFIRVAAGGVVKADSSVTLSAAYIAIGQAFRGPDNPNDTVVPFKKSDPASLGNDYFLPPTPGSGNLVLSARLIDVGTTVLREISSASLNANNGDLRGNGSFSIAGDLLIAAAQVYPTTLAKFNIFAYDHGGLPGSVTISRSGTAASPLSAGGSLAIYASNIYQGGVLHAPLGSITLGWDGTDTEPSNPTSKGTIAVPVSKNVVLQSGSVTSVAGIDLNTGAELLIPYGLSPDGLSWIDPRGVNITVSGLPAKTVTIAGDSVVTQPGSVVDVRGGGEIFASRWIQGNGGPIDLLGSASAAWSSASNYKAGDLVTYQDPKSLKTQTWSARVSIDAGNFVSSPAPAVGSYWTRVDEAFAIVPGYTSSFAPYAAYNTGVNASLLNGNPGYVGSGITIGDQIYLDQTPGLAAGSYTLLPRAFALLPGAFLVTPTGSSFMGRYTSSEGAAYTTGYRFNALDKAQKQQTLRSTFELASDVVLQARADYAAYGGSQFFKEAAARLGNSNVQLLAVDSGKISFQGNAFLSLGGAVRYGHAIGGRGAQVDISSLMDIAVIGGTGTAPGGTASVLSSGTLSGWGADSILIGGRRLTTATGVSLDVRTNRLVVSNAGGELSAPEIILAAKQTITVDPGSSIVSSGHLTTSPIPHSVTGDGAVLWTSGNKDISLTRTGVTGSTIPRLTVGAGAILSGAAIIADSTYSSNIDPDVQLTAESLTLNSGQLSILLQPQSLLSGSVVSSHLILSGNLLDQVSRAASLSLGSYRTIDVYGSGTFGSASLKELKFRAGGDSAATPAGEFSIRGFNQGAGTALFVADSVIFENPSNVTGLAAPAGGGTGRFEVEAKTIRFGANGFGIAGYENNRLVATGGILSQLDGGFSVAGNLLLETPLVAGASGSIQTISSSGVLSINKTGGLPTVTSGLGGQLFLRGTAVNVASDILLPSGLVDIRTVGSSGGGINISGRLDVSGTSKTFYDSIRYSGGGEVRLVSSSGNVLLQSGSKVSVAANSGGGDAGTILISAVSGLFSSLGVFEGNASPTGDGGSFELDAGSIGSFSDLAQVLNTGGFSESRDFRVRSGSITVDGVSKVRNYKLAVDAGSLTVTGKIDASGITGGTIHLIARDNLTVAGGGILTVAADNFSNAGTGGEIDLEAGSQINGATPDPNVWLDLQTGATIDLSVKSPNYVPGSYTTPYSSAFYGQFTGVLHLRAPRNSANTDLQIKALNATINGASSIIAEGYEITDLTTVPGGAGLITGWRSSTATINTAAYLPTAGTTQRTIYDRANSFLSTTNADNMRIRLLGALDPQNLAGYLVIAPGAEIINRTGDLTLGLTNGTTLGSAILNSADWNLSDFRFGPKQAPGVLTLRASRDIIFNNALSDGFTPVVVNSANGDSSLWLGQLKDIDTRLPINTQSWSYRITAGADFSSASSAAVVKDAAATGSVLVGQFYPAVPNSNSGFPGPAVGGDGQTANSIRISTTTANLGTRFEVVRTGAGSIAINAAKDVQLRNQFATIYTAGVRIPDPRNIYSTGDFRPATFYFSNQPTESGIGASQQNYGQTTINGVIFRDEAGVQRRIGQYAMAGGDVSIRAGQNIGHYTQATIGGILTTVDDSVRQLPMNWLMRRGSGDSNGAGSVEFNPDGGSPELVDPLASTTWWIDYSNFFEGAGALGGGEVSIDAGNDVVNFDAVVPTNARMAGRNALGATIAPDPALLHELGGGDLRVRAGRNIDGGVYYVENGNASLFARGEVKTNSSRAPYYGLLGGPNPATNVLPDSRTWLPTTLFVGKGKIDVAAYGNILLGPVLNPFLLPAGLNNRAYYGTYFSTYSPTSSVNVSSFGGDITHRLSVTRAGSTFSQPTLSAWLESQNRFSLSDSQSASSYYQPWIRLATSDMGTFATTATVFAPNLRSTAFNGDLAVVGSLNLFPSATGNLELEASGSIQGLQPTGIGRTSSGSPGVSYVSARINLSDADPARISGIASPSGKLASSTVFLAEFFNETGSYTGAAASADVKQALHSSAILHLADAQPLKIYAAGGDISGLTLFSSKKSQIMADQDISDIAFYLQNANKDSVTVVSAGRDIIAFNENTASRTMASDLSQGNFIADPPQTTVLTKNNTPVTNVTLSGDIQISGQGTLEVLAGRNLDLGSGPNLLDGRGVGITSIGRLRNPFLAFEGADIVALSGVAGNSGGAALGLSNSSLAFKDFIAKYITPGDLPDVDFELEDFNKGSEEQQAVDALKVFFALLRRAGEEQVKTGSYESGYEAVDALIPVSTAAGRGRSGNSPSYGWGPWLKQGASAGNGDVSTRSRDIRTTSGGEITMLLPTGGVNMATDLSGNSLTPPGIVTEYGGAVSIFTQGDVSIGQSRIFTLRGGDLTIWSSSGDIAAGAAAKTVVTAPPTRVSLDSISADVQTDLGGLATGGGIGVLASVADVEPGNVALIAPKGTVDAGDAGIRSTGNIVIAAVSVLNADNVSAAGTSVGVPAAATVAAPNIGGLTSGASASAATTSASNAVTQGSQQQAEVIETPSVITVDILGYGGGEEE